MKQGIPCKLAHVNTMQQPELQQRFKIREYPYLLLFENGRNNPAQYTGERNTESIEQFMREKAGNGSTELENLIQAKQWITLWKLKSETHSRDQKRFNAATLLACVDNAAGDAWDEFLKIVSLVREEFAIAYSLSSQICEYFKVPMNTVRVILLPNFRNKHEKVRKATALTGAKTLAVVDQLRKDALPLIGLATRSNYETAYALSKQGLAKPQLTLFSWRAHDDPATIAFWRKRLTDVAHEFPDIQFAVASNKVMGDSLIESVGLQDMEEVAVSMFYSRGSKYRMPLNTEVTEKSIRAFVESVRSGQAKQFLKTVKVPKKRVQKRSPVKIVVGSTFEKLVLDPSKHVFIELYAPWCEVCKELRPAMDALAKETWAIKDVVVAKMDADANDTPISCAHSNTRTFIHAMILCQLKLHRSCLPKHYSLAVFF